MARRARDTKVLEKEIRRVPMRKHGKKEKVTVGSSGKVRMTRNIHPGIRLATDGKSRHGMKTGAAASLGTTDSGGIKERFGKARARAKEEEQERAECQRSRRRKKAVGKNRRSRDCGPPVALYAP